MFGRTGKTASEGLPLAPSRFKYRYGITRVGREFHWEAQRIPFYGQRQGRIERLGWGSSPSRKDAENRARQVIDRERLNEPMVAEETQWTVVM